MALPKKPKRGRAARRRRAQDDSEPKAIVLRNAADLEKLIPNVAMKALRLSDVLPSGRLGRAHWTDWNYESAATEGYKSSVWCFVCIWRIATSAGSVPWRVESGSEDTSWAISPGHALASLINKPNYFESRQQYIERLTIHNYLGGDGIQSKTRVNGVPVELWNIRPDVIAPVPVKGRNRQIAYYEVKVDGKVIRRIKPKDIVHQMIVNPTESFRGMAPTEPAGSSIDIDREASDWRKKSLENRAVASGILSYKHKISKPQFDEARVMLRQQIQGSDNALDVLIIGNDAQWNQLSMSPVEMDYIGGSKLTREEICAGYGVPPTVAGILENATLANLEASWVAFWMNTVVPYLDRVKAAWNHFLTPEFGDNIRLQYDLSRVPALQPLFRANIDAAERLWKMGVPFEAINKRLELGFEQFPGWEFGYVNNRTVRIEEDGSFTPLEVLTADDGDSDEDDEDQPGANGGNGAFPTP